MEGTTLLPPSFAMQSTCHFSVKIQFTFQKTPASWPRQKTKIEKQTKKHREGQEQRGRAPRGWAGAADPVPPAATGSARRTCDPAGCSRVPNNGQRPSRGPSWMLQQLRCETGALFLQQLKCCVLTAITRGTVSWRF